MYHVMFVLSLNMIMPMLDRMNDSKLNVGQIKKKSDPEMLINKLQMASVKWK